MSWFGWLRATKPRLDATQQQRLAQLSKPAILGGDPLRSAQQLSDAVKQAAKGSTLPLQILRRGATLFVALPIS